MLLSQPPPKVIIGLDIFYLMKHRVLFCFVLEFRKMVTTDFLTLTNLLAN